jgi:hypothetical protein
MVAITSGTMKRRPRVVASAVCHWNCHPDSSRGSDSLAIVDGEHQPPGRRPAPAPPRPPARPDRAGGQVVQLDPDPDRGRTRLKRAGDRGPFGQGAHLWGWLAPASLLAAEGRGRVGLGHGVPEGRRLQGRLHRHGATSAARPPLGRPRPQAVNAASSSPIRDFRRRRPAGQPGGGEAAPTGEKLSVVAGRHRARCEPQSGRDLPCRADPTV